MTEVWNDGYNIRIRWSSECDASNGLWECSSCGSQFYGGGEAIHKRGCEVEDYSNCIFLFGDKTIENTVIDFYLPEGVGIERLIACRDATADMPRN